MQFVVVALASQEGKEYRRMSRLASQPALGTRPMDVVADPATFREIALIGEKEISK